jgi:hypothetical protein
MVSVGRVGRDVEGVINIKIGRGTPLGNPFYMADESMRDEVCDKYEAYFHAEVKKQGAFRDEVIRLYKLVKSGKSINLQCYCAPKRCHGHTIKAFIESFL